MYQGESVVPRIHTFPRDYTHNFTWNYTFVFTPEYHEITVAHARENTHKPTGAHERSCRPTCKNADAQAHAGPHTRMCRLARSRRQHARTSSQAHMHVCSCRCSRMHTRSHTYTQVRMHARRGTHAPSFA